MIRSSARDACILALSDENIGKLMCKNSLRVLRRLCYDSREQNKDLCISHKLLKELTDASGGRLSYSAIVLGSTPLFPRSGTSPPCKMVNMSGLAAI